jgi:hypothetical protein
LPYRDVSVDAFRSLFHAVGALAIVLGLVRFIFFIPVQLLYWRYQHVTGTVPKTGFFFWARSISFCASTALAIWLFVGGIGCIRLRPRARRLLVGWALATMAYAICGMAINAYSSLSLLGTRRSLDIFVSLASSTEQWLASLIFPVVVLVVMSRSVTKDAFERI